MGKRSSYTKIPKDKYFTIDEKAIPPNLVKHIQGKTFYEPCVGGGDLVSLLSPHGATCVGGGDIDPVVGETSYPVSTKDGLEVTEEDLNGADLLVSNPPYTKDVLLPLIDHWTSLRPVWLLLPTTHMHVKYFAPYMAKCSNIVSIGRLYFFENEWVVKKPFEHGELDSKWDKQLDWYDFTKGIKYYTGYLTPDGKPNKQKFVRGVEDYCWYCFHNTEQITIFETRGE